MCSYCVCDICTIRCDAGVNSSSFVHRTYLIFRMVLAFFGYANSAISLIQYNQRL